MIPPCSTEQIDERELPKPGDVLSGKYRVEREIGRGGMGVVYEVTHVVMTHSRFAIKWLVEPGGSDSEAIRRFRREARVCGAIRHPNVVEVYDVNLDDSGSYMVMELLQGESLSQRIEREGALHYSEACRIVRAALSGVAAAHALGVVHRDLKPANIFLCRAAEGAPALPKVVDFGISRVIAAPGNVDTTETRRGTRIGTPLYMAPEQMRAQECDQRTDVYAFGVTLYEAISGRRAFQADTEAELVYKVLAGEVPELDEVVTRLPAGLSAIVMRAMALAPEQRFASALQLSAALEPYERGDARQVAARGAGATGPRRWPWLGVAAVSGAAALGLWLWPSVPSGVGEQTVAAPATQAPPTAATTDAPNPPPTNVHIVRPAPRAFAQPEPEPTRDRAPDTQNRPPDSSAFPGATPPGNASALAPNAPSAARNPDAPNAPESDAANAARRSAPGSATSESDTPASRAAALSAARNRVAPSAAQGSAAGSRASESEALNAARPSAASRASASGASDPAVNGARASAASAARSAVGAGAAGTGAAAKVGGAARGAASDGRRAAPESDRAAASATAPSPSAPGSTTPPAPVAPVPVRPLPREKPVVSIDSF